MRFFYVPESSYLLDFCLKISETDSKICVEGSENRRSNQHSFNHLRPKISQIHRTTEVKGYVSGG